MLQSHIPGTAGTHSVEGAIEWLKADPYGGNVLDRVSHVAAAIHREFANNRVANAIAYTAQVIDLERAAPEESSPRYCYGIALQKLLTAETVRSISDHGMSQQNREALGKVLARSGNAGMGVVAERVRESHSFTEARDYLQTLRAAGVEYGLLAPLLRDPKWHVVASTVETIGDMGLEEAIPELSRLIEHEDHRVEQLALDALARMTSWSAATKVKEALTSKNVKRQSTAARAIGRRKSSAFVSPLIGLTEDKGIKPDVLAECYDALGNIGTNGAREALVEAAKPGGRLVHRKSVAQRLAAIHGLSFMEADMAAEDLEELSRDKEKAVRDAAQKALEAVAKRGK